MPALGYPCAVCESKKTKSRFAESSDEEESNLLWMELQCKHCQNNTLYTRKQVPNTKIYTHTDIKQLLTDKTNHKHASSNSY